VGSITHCTGFVGAVVAPVDSLQAIGFDAERDTPLANDLISLICTVSEIEWLRSHAASGVDWAKVIFSAKESVHKCIWPLCGQTLDFLDVTVAIDTDRMTFSARETKHPSLTGLNLEMLDGRIAIAEPIIFASAFMSPNARI
jgi:4'-phosphopantetheinyl transferase EntD